MSENDCLDLIDTASVVLFFALFGWFAFLHGKKSQRKTKIKFIIFVAALLGLYALIFIPCLQLDYFK